MERNLWCEGYMMYDGTIVVLYCQPSHQGQGYYTYKANYGLNVQIGNAPSNLRIVDGHTGATHDSYAFESTCAYKYPGVLFKGDEFAWGDSAYAVSPRMMPIHKKPAADLYENQKFDKAVSHIRV
uniref:DDE Tnp4 domain-containing protein n=1 Tax=Moniliophthora roreri TaxID=221103 RepID=A0A0W0FI44_MONRR